MHKTALLGALLVVLLASGCSKKEHTAKDYSADGTPAFGATFVQASIGEASNLIPWLATDTASHDVSGMIYPSLLKYDKDLNLAPYLAESWEVSPDGLSLTFHLRKNAVWEDGQPVTAADVMASYQTIIAPSTQTPYAEKYKLVTHADTPDAYTFRVTYAAPFAPALASWAELSILPKHKLDACPDLMACDLKRQPLGTGPYKLLSWQSGKEIELTARHDHFEHRPYIERVRTRLITDLDAQFLELKTGRIDSMGLKPVQYAKLTDSDAFTRRYAKYNYLGNNYVYLGFNLNNSLFTDKRVRQALSFATPRDALVKGVLLGYGIASAGPFKPGTWAADDTLKPYPYDVDKANQLLSAAGWIDTDGDGIRDKDGNPFSFTVVTNQGNDQRIKTAEIMQFTFRQVGVDMHIRVQEWATFIENTINKRQFDAFILGWQLTPEPDPYDIWHSSKTGPREFNIINYKNADVDRLIEAARNTFDQTERKKYYAQFQQILYDEQPYLFLYTPLTLTALHKRFKGVVPAPAGLMYNFIDWYVPAEQQIYTPQTAMVP
ncbi:MAG: peptide-binding protein [Proteobacteria bacterium]|nr:peptide-binding protein [Pseudomonadota bacterium]